MTELECIMLFSGIMSIGISIFIAMAIILIVDYPDKHRLNKRYMIPGIIGLIISIISLSIFVRSCKIYYSPELSHERVLNGFNKAEKELQKFYIDHPEFKENKE